MSNKVNIAGVSSIILGIISFFICWRLAIIGVVIAAISYTLTDTEKITPSIGIGLNAVSLLLFIILCCVAMA